MDFIRKIFARKEPTETETQKKEREIIEKRKFPRIEESESTYLYPPNRAPIQIRIVDISAGGLKLESREIIDVGAHMGIGLYTKGQVVKIMIKARWESKGKAGYTYGAEFASNDPRDKALIKQYIDERKTKS